MGEVEVGVSFGCGVGVVDSGSLEGVVVVGLGRFLASSWIVGEGSELEGVDSGFEGVYVELIGVDSGSAGVDSGFEGVDSGFAGVDSGFIGEGVGPVGVEAGGKLPPLLLLQRPLRFLRTNLLGGGDISAPEGTSGMATRAAISLW